MIRRMMSACLAGLAVVAMLGCGGKTNSTATDGPHGGPVGNPLYKRAYSGNTKSAGEAGNLIVIDGCRVVVMDKQDVPSQRDGVVLKFDVREGQFVPKGAQLAQLDDRLALADVAI